MIRLELTIDKNEIRVSNPTGAYWTAKNLSELPQKVADCLRGYAQTIKIMADTIPATETDMPARVGGSPNTQPYRDPL